MAIVTIAGGVATVQDANGRRELEGRDPLRALEAYLQTFAAEPAEGLPEGFCGGAVGYLGYEAARYLERLPIPDADPLDVADGVFIVTDTLACFDHVRHQLKLVTHVRTQRAPIEARYAEFQWEVAKALLRRTGKRALPFINFWPQGHRYAFVLTHDVETAAGQDQVAALAELDASYGFRSSFNFVPERYAVDRNLLAQLRSSGFEIGVHGLKHDGKLFSSYGEFMRRARSINRYLNDFGAVGFRAPLTHRNPTWMQALEIDYDLSFFDSDPYEPIPGGTMSLWPFEIGRFVELPYTLVQDYTLTEVLRETTPRLWLEKADFIASYGGLVLVNTHPDYLKNPITRSVYIEFLAAMRSRADFWQALPMEIANWWRARSRAQSLEELDGGVAGLIDESGTLRLPSDSRTVIAVG